MITTWAGKHPRVHVLPFAETLTRMRAGEPITLGGREVTRDPQELFQEDQIHVTVKGQALLGIMTLEALQAALPELPRTGFVQDLAAFEGTLLKLEHTLAESRRSCAASAISRRSPRSRSPRPRSRRSRASG